MTVARGREHPSRPRALGPNTREHHAAEHAARTPEGQVTGGTTLLINPPLWNAYAPHLALPILAGVLRSQGLDVRCHDASLEVLDWLLSAEGQTALAPRLARTTDQRLAAKAALVHREVVPAIDEAKKVLRDATALHNAQQQAWARRVVRNAMWCVSSSFDGSDFDLVANRLYHSANSTAEVLAAMDDPERNVYRWALDRLVPAALLADPDLGVVGLSVSADTQLIAAMTVASATRRARPDVKIVMGGNYATRMVDRWTRAHPFFRYVDAFVLSEGEEALPELVRRYQAGAPVDGIPGVVTAQDGELRGVPARAVRLDAVPRPDFSDLPLDRYFSPGPILPLYASRSCAWECAFCSIPFASNNFRRRPASVTVDHLESLMVEHGTRYFMFVDEILTLNVLRDVAAEIVARGLDVLWYGETRFAGGFTQRLADLLYESGCRRLNFGLESYNQRVLDVMRKGTKVEHIDGTVDKMLKAGIAPHLFVIHGFPGETPEEAARTVAYAKSVVARSEEEYGNPYTTWGGAPFVLDVHSPIGKAPEEFGVRLIDPPPEDDLSLARDYEVLQAGALTRPQAEQFAARAHDRTSVTRNVWFRTSTESGLAEVEEYTFVRTCMSAPNAEPLRRLGATPVPDADETVELAGACMLMPWPADESGRCDALSLYSGKRDSFVQLSWPRGAGSGPLEGSQTAGGLAIFFNRHGVSWGQCFGLDLVRLLVRHGLLTTKDPATLRLRLTDDSDVGAEPAVLEAGGHDDPLVLHSPVVGNTVRLNVLGQIAWRMCAAGPSTVATISNECSPDGRLLPVVRTAIRDLVELGFLYLTSPPDSEGDLAGLGSARTAPE